MRARSQFPIHMMITKSLRRSVCFVVALTLSAALLGCSPQAPQPSRDCLDPIVPQPAMTLSVVSRDTTYLREVILADGTQQTALDQQLGMFSSDSHGWAQLVQFPGRDDAYQEFVNPLVFTEQQNLDGIRILVRNEYAASHAVRLVPLWDYLPVQVVEETGQSSSYVDLPALAPHEEAAIELQFRMVVNPGFHQFSFLLIADPESTSTDADYRFVQRSSIHEYRYDVWVGHPPDPSSALHWTNLDEGFIAGTRFVLADVVDPDTQELITSLEVKAGERICLSIRVNNPDPAEADAITDIPVWVGVAWNDSWASAQESVLPGSAPPNHIFDTSVRAPTQPGAYQLMGIVISSPHMSQFTAPGERVGIAGSAATVRVMVIVNPK